MKIAFLTHEPFFPPSGGGSAEAIYLVEELVRRSHQVHLFGPAIPDIEVVAKKFGIRIHPFQSWQMGRYTPWRTPKYLLYPRFLAQLVERAARETKFDLVLSQHAISAVAAAALKRRLNVPVIMNFLDYLTGFMETWPPYLAPPPLLRLLKKFELNLPLRAQAEGLLTVSDTLADLFAQTGYPRERILPIYYGFDSELFPFQPPRKQREPVLVMHGSLDHHHLRQIAFEGISLVMRQRPEVRLRIVGQRTRALEKFLSQMRPRISLSRIECTGFIPYTEVAQTLASSTIGIVPYEESIGTHCAFVAKIVEYLAAGLFVASTPLQSAQRYFHDEKMIRFSQFDGRDFGQTILSWLDEVPEKYQDAAQAASNRVRRELDWRAISRKAIQFIEDSVTSRNFPP